MMAKRTISLLGLVLLAAGCAPESDTVPAPTLGEAVNYNMAVHIMPIPPSAAAGSPTDVPGRRGDVLMERYMTGKVKKPVLEKSQSLAK